MIILLGENYFPAWMIVDQWPFWGYWGKPAPNQDSSRVNFAKVTETEVEQALSEMENSGFKNLEFSVNLVCKADPG